MAHTNQRETPNSDKALDKEYAEMLEKEGDHIVGDEKEDDVSEEEQPEEEVKEEEEEPEPVKEEVEEEEEATSDEKEEEEEEVDDDPEEEEEKTQPTRKARPEKYIPVAKYTDEKRQWKEKEDELTNQITELKKATAGTKENSPERDEAIKKYAEITGLDPEKAAEALDTARQLLLPKETIEALEKVKNLTEEKADEEYFDNEWDEFRPTLESEFPEATAKQKSEAKKLMDQIASTRKYALMPLDEVFEHPKIREQFNSILGTPTKKKGPEGSKKGSGVEKSVSAKDFQPNKEGNYDFANLLSMSEGPDKNKIISDLEPDAYVAYIDALEATNEGIEVRRGGRTIKLK